MKVFIASLLFLASLVMRVPVLFAQQDPSYQKLVQEVKVLKEQVSTLQDQLQTVENVEKMKLSAELAAAKTELINTEFSKFERELRDSNDGWLMKWNGFFIGVLAVFLGLLALVGRSLWLQFKSDTDRLIANEVGKRVNRFEEAVDRLDEIKDQLKVLQAGHAISVLEHFTPYYSSEESHYREQTTLIPEEALVQVLGDETRYLSLRLKAADVLAYRKSPLLVAPLLELMHSIVDDDRVYHYHDINSWGYQLIKPLGQIHTQASYQGLKKFLNRLLTEDLAHKGLLLPSTVFTLAAVSVELNEGDLVSILRESIADLEVDSHHEDALIKFAEYFDKFKEPEGIRNILTNGLTDKMPNVETRCLGLLAEYDPNFVNDWRERKASANTETEETS